MNSRNPNVSILHGANGMILEVINFGARLHRLRIPLAGDMRDVCLTYPNAHSYVNDPYYLGACIGRYAGRLGNSEILIDGVRYALDNNEPAHGNCLHGGSEGFSEKYWNISSETGDSLEYELNCAHGDQGFPGALRCSARYTVHEENEFSVTLSAQCEENTVVNLAHHAYYNLNGQNAMDISSIENHSVRLPLTHYVPLNDQLLAQPNPAPLEELGISSNEFRTIGEIMSHQHPQLALTGGLDHYMFDQAALDKRVSSAPDLRQSKLMATLMSEDQRVQMEIYSTSPGLHIYTGNFLSSPWHKHQGICFEAQGWPNGFQERDLPNNFLPKATHYSHTTRYKFDVQ